MKKIDLCGKWEVYDENGKMHMGEVPGCIHTDLFSAEEMFWEKNSEKCRFIEEKDWKYVKKFHIEEVKENAELVFEGLDTYCEITLNGKILGKTENMFIRHKFCVDGILRQGENLLEVQIFSPIKSVQDKEKLPGAFTTERLHSRRMQCTYSWDWVDRFVTSGIYRPVYLCFCNEMEVDNVYVVTTGIDDYSGQVKIKEKFRKYEKGALVTTKILSPQGMTVFSNQSWCEEEEMILYADIEDPQLWYPRPYGEQPLYTLTITVGTEIFHQTFGIRTVKVLQLKDKEEGTIKICRELQAAKGSQYWDLNEEYSGFQLLVNGIRIFCTGANWVPCEPFPSAETEEKITLLLEKAAAANINMVRVWGGGLFEKQHFYDECDRLGIMVTQDFLMACGQYPEKEKDFQEHLRKEAEFAAVYLRNHPSLVWWTGDNENAIAGDSTLSDYKGRTSAKKVIAPVLEKLDYARPFFESSPYGGKRFSSKTVGTTHNTHYLGDMFEYFKEDDLSDYREFWKQFRARFIAEEPVFGAVCKSSLREFMAEEHEQDHDLWLYHTKNNPFFKFELMDILIEFAEKLFGRFKDWEDQYFKMRYLQYEWVRLTMGNARGSMWFNSGIIYWMLDDCWPAAMGWSLCDYYTRERAGYYAMKHFADPVTAVIDKAEEGYVIHLSSIFNHHAVCSLKVDIVDLATNEVRTIKEEEISLAPGNTDFEILCQLKNEEVLIAQVQCGEKIQRNWYKQGTPRLKKIQEFSWKLSEAGVLAIKAEAYIHVLELEGFDSPEDNYFSLLPGEKRILKLHDCTDLSKTEINAYTFE